MSRITTAFTADSTAHEVVEGIDLTGKRIVVTGAASGIGIETARALAGAGATVTLAVRNQTAGQEVADKINSEVGSQRATVAPLELADQGSIRAFAQAWGDTPLDILINNAGVMAAPLHRDADGWESQFATNHLGHFALANRLRPALAAAEAARVVSVSSRGHLFSPVVFDDINFTVREYDPWAAYGQSKTANILFAVGLTQRWASDGITANALHPGAIVTPLMRHLAEETAEQLVEQYRSTFKTPEQGAATSVLVATSPLLAGIGGRYFEDCNEAEPNHGPYTRTTPEETPAAGVADFALDPELAARLWELS
ncbi:MAG TPA: SDR family NAD(P)-dependent oxidoreductase, partial [Pseudonocardia sp.]|nr:SDR family NAD(P)-dependent oxidoreductase [Pseudonocardia sp.]